MQRILSQAVYLIQGMKHRGQTASARKREEHENIEKDKENTKKKLLGFDEINFAFEYIYCKNIYVCVYKYQYINMA